MHGNGRNVASTAQPQAQSQPQEPQPYFYQHQFGGSVELTTTLVHALSDVVGVDVTEAEFRIGDHVDPDALNRLFEPAPDELKQSNGYVSFNVWGYQVTIYYNGQIVIAPPAPHPGQ